MLIRPSSPKPMVTAMVKRICKRICPKCGVEWYSAGKDSVWVCNCVWICDCGAEIPVPESDKAGVE